MCFPKIQDGAFLSDNNELDTLLASSKEMEHLGHESVFNGMQTYLIEEIETSLSVGFPPIGGHLLRELTKRLGSILAFLHILAR